jgi:NitT/TauT family transport system substrate-binding protein
VILAVLWQLNLLVLSRRFAMARTALAVVSLSLLALSPACAGDTGSGDPASSLPTVFGTPVEAGAAFPADRCEANRAAGTITYLSSFDFAASASIVEVLVAEDRGYFDELCLDVVVKPSFSTDNYPLLAANKAQFSSAGSFSEVIDYAAKNDASFVALAVEGKTGIDALVVKDGVVEDGQTASLTDLRGTTIGVKGRITPSVAAMLKKAGLTEGTDFKTVLLDGFDPKVHIAVSEIVGFPGYKSNEPLQLEAAGIPFTLFDPADSAIPGSFGVLYTNGTFLAEHPTAAQDFIRAAMKGLADAVAEPVAAAEIAVGYINANGNAMFLSPEGETARWGVESKLVVATNTNTALGVPETELLIDEVSTYAEIGLFDGRAPDIAPYVDVGLISGIYAEDHTVVWPGK